MPWDEPPFQRPLEAPSEVGSSNDHMAWPKLLSPPPPNSDEPWQNAGGEFEPSLAARILVPIFLLSLACLVGFGVWQYDWVIEQIQLLIDKWL